jgi:hypothetical protein
MKGRFTTLLTESFGFRKSGAAKGGSVGKHR